MAEASVRVELTLLDILVKQCVKDSTEWFPEAADATATDLEARRRAGMHHALALCGEAGEVANWMKKMDRGSYDFDNEIFQHSIKEEIVDVFIYILNLAGLFEMDLLKAYVSKRDKNVKRFGKPGKTNGAVR
jgi:NTP pyrophosphatase (non-canonical NTP hydrolase)